VPWSIHCWSLSTLGIGPGAVAGHLPAAQGADDGVGAIEHHLAVELGYRGGDLREVPGERALLARLQDHPLGAMEGDAVVC
jgi:hypothetical protein